MVGAACYKEATDLGKQRSSHDRLDNTAVETRVADYEADSDEEEALAEDVPNYFQTRPVGEKKAAAWVAVADCLSGRLDIVANQLRNSTEENATLGKLKKESLIRSSTSRFGLPLMAGRNSGPNLKFLFAPPNVNVVLELTKEEVLEDLLLMSEGSSLKGKINVAKPATTKAARGVSVNPGIIRTTKAPTSKATAAAEKSVTTNAVRGRDATAEKDDTSARDAGGSGKKRRFKCVDDVEPAAPRSLPAAKKQKPYGDSMATDSIMFTRHTKMKELVVCKMCCANVWPRNCNRHLRQCKKGRRGGGESDGVLEG